MYFGAAYYPEHWPEPRWQQDADLMQQGGFNLVRLGEFAWCRMEPEPDVFAFDWLDRALEVFQARGIHALIGTPTAGPPAWLYEADTPEHDCRFVYEDGVRPEFGQRSSCCPNHPYFQERSARIAGALGAHFGAHPAVIGFQLDNELGMYGHRCYCDVCRERFRAWLKAKYGTIAELNRRLGMVFGSGEFRHFDDVPLPRARQDLHNPGLLLDSQRFYSDSNGHYLQLQAEAIRAAGAKQPITTNIAWMYHENQLDPSRLFASLDVVGWDCYPAQFGTPPKSETMGLLHAIARGEKRQRYWMLEQQAGSPATTVADDVRKIRLWTWQSLAHGAEMILYFNWRTCRFGGEQYWRGVLDHDGDPNARYEMIAATLREATHLSATLEKLERPNDAAILLDYDSLSSLSLASPGGGIGYRAHAEVWYAAILRAGRGCDVVYTGRDLSKYRLIVAPLLRLMDAELAAQLKAWVHDGGTLIATTLTAVLDRDHVAPEAFPPHLLQEVFGVEQIEWSSLAGLPAPPKESLGGASEAWKDVNAIGQVPVEPAPESFLTGTYRCGVWCDHLRLRGAETLATFAAGSPPAGLPAVTVNRYGSGTAYYVGSLMDARLCRDLVAHVVGPNASPIRPLPQGAEADIEIVPVRHGSDALYFLLNHDGQPRTVALQGRFTDLATSEECLRTLQIAPYDVRLLRAHAPDGSADSRVASVR